MDLSIVTTMYYSAPYLDEFYYRIKIQIEKITNNYEIIIVNDGSPDNSLELALTIQKNDNNVKIIDLSRNFGHHKAIMTGLSYAKGNKVFLIDCDLEEEPELLEVFWKEYHSYNNIDVIYGVQKERKGKFLERITGEIFYCTINYLSNVKMPKNIITARLMSNRYVQNLVKFNESELFLAGIWHITGFEQKPVIVNKHSKGTTTYSFGNKIGIVINSITSFSNKPLLFIVNTGMFISFVSFLYIIYLIIAKMFFNIPLQGWTSLIVSVWFIGGITIFFLGVIGIYISKIFIETKNRPYTIIKEVYERVEGNEEN